MNDEQLNRLQEFLGTEANESVTALLADHETIVILRESGIQNVENIDGKLRELGKSPELMVALEQMRELRELDRSLSAEAYLSYLLKEVENGIRWILLRAIEKDLP